jgi:hypothetical protein
MIAESAFTIARNKIARLRNIHHLGLAGMQPARRPEMRVMETLTGSVLSVATFVLAVGALVAL